MIGQTNLKSWLIHKPKESWLMKYAHHPQRWVFLLKRYTFNHVLDETGKVLRGRQNIPAEIKAGVGFKLQTTHKKRKQHVSFQTLHRIAQLQRILQCPVSANAVTY